MVSQREKYKLVRYEYYHAGRILHQMGNFHAAGIMLGYTVETIMKAALIEVLSEEEQQKSKVLTKSHDIVKIFNECRKNGIFKSIKVSQDFLNHINNNFQRYPTQMLKVFNDSLESKIVLVNSQSFLNYYDSFVCDLDMALFKQTNDISSSIIYFALRTLETRYARDILHRNAFALNYFDFYADLVKSNLPENIELRDTCINGLNMPISSYWDKTNPDSYTEIASDILNGYSYSTFTFQKWKA